MVGVKFGSGACLAGSSLKSTFKKGQKARFERNEKRVGIAGQVDGHRIMEEHAKRENISRTTEA